MRAEALPDSIEVPTGLAAPLRAVRPAPAGLSRIEAGFYPAGAYRLKSYLTA